MNETPPIPLEEPSESRTPSLVLGIVAICAAVLANPFALAPILAADRKIDDPLVRVGLIGLELCLFVYGTRTLGRGRPKTWGPFAAPATIALGALCLVGAAGLARNLRAEPWEASGLEMSERLSRLARRDPEIYFYGRDPKFIQREIEKARSVGGLRALEHERQLADTHLRRGDFYEAATVLESILTRLEGNESPRRAAFQDDVENLLVSTYLRWAEIENCTANHNQDSCLLPLEGGGVHQKPEQMRKAHARFSDSSDTSPSR